VAKLKDVVTGDVLVDHRCRGDRRTSASRAGDSFAITPKAKGDEGEDGTRVAALVGEDPTLALRRDPQTGEQLLYGLTQMQGWK
jgi:translation elongation factor EF-G